MLKHIRDNKKNIFIFLFFIIIQILLHPTIMKNSFFFAEDGGIFYNDIVKYNFMGLFKTHGGYLCILSRLFVYVGYLLSRLNNSILIVGRSISFLSILFVAFIFTYFCTDKYDYIFKHKKTKYLFSILAFLLSATFNNMLYNGVCLHWYCGLFVFMIGIQLLYKQMPSWFIIIITCICILSSPSSLLIAFPMLLYLLKIINVKKIKNKQYLIETIKKNKVNLFKIISLGLAILVQVFAILFISDMAEASSQAITISSLFNALKQTVEFSVSSIIFCINVKLFYKLLELKIVFYIGLFLLLILVGFSIYHKNTKFLIYSFIYITVLYFMILFKRTCYNLEWLYDSNSSFFHMIPSVIYMLIIFKNIDDLLLKKHKNIIIYIFAIICLALGVNYIINLDEMDLSKNENLYKIENYVDYSSNKYIDVDLTPYVGYCTIKVPVSENYFKGSKE